MALAEDPRAPVQPAHKALLSIEELHCSALYKRPGVADRFGGTTALVEFGQEAMEPGAVKGTLGTTWELKMALKGCRSSRTVRCSRGLW